MKNFQSKFSTVALLSMSLMLGACSDDDDDDMMMTPDPMPTPTPMPMPENVSYDVTVKNLTYGQPLSPIAVVLHDEGKLWMVGEMASTELEMLAEGGDNSGILGLSVVNASVSGSAPLGPGASQTLTVTIEDKTDSMLSLATMLVNTNDAFTGLNAVDLSGLAVGDSWSSFAGVYDSGTEGNSEMAGTIPGPADGGTGFEAARDDVDFVSKHPGVVSNDDGLMTSVLTEAHRFDNPAVHITITRTE